MTATQPMIFKKEESIEVAEMNEEIRTIPQRVSFVIKNDHNITLNEFCNEMNDLISKYQEKNILIELNIIFTTKECFDNIHSDSHDMRFLSSQVIPRHTRPRINRIKQQLDYNDNKKADPNTPTAMAIFAGGNVSLRRLKAAGTAANPIPWIILLTNRNVILCANPPAVIPATYKVSNMSNTFFLP